MLQLKFNNSNQKYLHFFPIYLITFFICTISGPEYYDTEMDKEFLLELRELKLLMDREKEHKQYNNTNF